MLIIKEFIYISMLNQSQMPITSWQLSKQRHVKMSASISGGGGAARGVNKGKQNNHENVVIKKAISAYLLDNTPQVPAERHQSLNEEKYRLKYRNFGFSRLYGIRSEWVEFL